MSKLRVTDLYDLSNLTEAEREQFGDLVKECRQREREIRENTASSYASLAQIRENFARMAENMKSMYEGIERLTDTTIGLAEKLKERTADLVMDHPSKRIGNA